MKSISSRGMPLFGAVAILLLIALSRMILLSDLYFDQDEVWSIWLSGNGFAEILRRNPFDSPPGYYFILAVWQYFAGASPFVMRFFLILLFMLNNAFLFALTKHLFKSTTGALWSMLAYSSLGYIVYLSVLLRPYLPVMLLFPLAFYLTERYFEKPTLRQGIFLGIVIAMMWYINLSSIFVYLDLGLYSLFKNWRSLPRWIFPGIVAFLLALPEIWSKFSGVLDRGSQAFETNLPPLPDALYERYLDYFGTYAIIWIILLVIAILLILISKKTQKRHLVFFLIWIIGGPILLYITHSRTGFFTFLRYGWWLAPGFALLVALALSTLNQRIQWIAGTGLAILLFVPQPIGDYKEPIPDFESTFEWLQDHYVAGDTVIIDPNCRCNRPEVWGYYIEQFFPDGLNIADEEQDSQRRIWYFRTIDREDSGLFSQISESRLSADFFGNPGFFLQLYIAPPDSEGILFENGLRFHGYEVLSNEDAQPEDALIYRAEGENVRLRLWWSIAEPLDADYSVGIKIWSERWNNIAEDDQTPQPIFLQPNLYDYAQPPGTMSTWEAGEVYVEERLLFIPYEPRLRRTKFTVFMTVYQWWDGVRILSDGVNEEGLLPLFDFTVVAW